MNIQPAGQEWLKRRFNLSSFSLTHASFIGTSHSIELTSGGNVEETFGSKYAVGNTPLDHVEFSLKYDDLNLDFLKAVFEQIPEGEIATYIEKSPAGMNRRRIGFLFEFLTVKTLKLSRPVSGNYADLLESEYYVTGASVKDTRWRINNNLLGLVHIVPW